jgi:hypothetical protein
MTDEHTRETNRIRQANYRATHRRSRSNAPTCVHCDRRIVGIPAGWKHVNDNRQKGADGHEAAPRSIR